MELRQVFLVASVWRLARLIQIDAARRVRQPRFQRTHTLPNKELVQLTLTLQHDDDDGRVNGNF